MSDNVIRFPTRPERNWKSIEQTIDGLLSNFPFSDESRGRIKEHLKAFHQILDHWPDIDLSGSFTRAYPLGTHTH